MGNAVPKQTYRKPKDERGDNPYKAQFAKTKPPPKGLAPRKPKPEEQRNALKTYREPKVWKGLKPGQGLGASTGTRTLQKRLQRLLVKRQGYKIQTLTHRPGFTLARGQGLKPIGPRGRRLAPDDRKGSASVKGLPCLCGCNTHERDPMAIQWMHLQRRNILETRHEEWATAPGCEHLHPWLDQGKGVKARRELFDLAQELGRRLTPEDAYPILSRWGYYSDLAAKTRI